jgi:hypothetical protein
MMIREELQALLEYNSENGHLKWLVRTAQRIQIGDRAGTVNPDGYRQIRVFGRIYKAHRLIWFYVYGEWPKGWIDHINGNRDDNRITNLRVANGSQNSANSRKRTGGRSQYKGIYFHPHSGLWCARVTKNYKAVYCAYFRTDAEAHAAYVKAARRVFGEFFNKG